MLAVLCSTIMFIVLFILLMLLLVNGVIFVRVCCAHLPEREACLCVPVLMRCDVVWVVVCGCLQVRKYVRVHQRRKALRSEVTMASNPMNPNANAGTSAVATDSLNSSGGSGDRNTLNSAGSDSLNGSGFRPNFRSQNTELAMLARKQTTAAAVGIPASPPSAGRKATLHSDSDGGSEDESRASAARSTSINPRMSQARASVQVLDMVEMMQNALVSRAEQADRFTSAPADLPPPPPPSAVIPPPPPPPAEIVSVPPPAPAEALSSPALQSTSSDVAFEASSIAPVPVPVPMLSAAQPLPLEVSPAFQPTEHGLPPLLAPLDLHSSPSLTSAGSNAADPLSPTSAAALPLVAHDSSSSPAHSP
jgi:hypothetical protein